MVVLRERRAKDRAQVDLVIIRQTGAQASRRGHTKAVAVLAKTFGHGADDAQRGAFCRESIPENAPIARRSGSIARSVGGEVPAPREALAQFSEVGRDTIFTDGAVSVVFANSTLESFEDVTFVL